jgi:hypothetical protein
LRVADRRSMRVAGTGGSVRLCVKSG